MERLQYNRIQEVLEEKNKDVYWLQSQLEGQTIPCVVRWCKNVKQPTIEELFEIAKVLEIDVRDLIVSTESNPNQDSCDTNIKTSMRQLNISKPIVNKEAQNFDLNSSLKDHKLSFMVFSKDAEFNYYSPIDNSLQWGYKKDESFFKNNEAIVIENAPLGVQAGHNAGIFTIAVNTGILKDEELTSRGCDLLYHNMNDFLQDLPFIIKNSQTTI